MQKMFKCYCGKKLKFFEFSTQNFHNNFTQIIPYNKTIFDFSNFPTFPVDFPKIGPAVLNFELYYLFYRQSICANVENILLYFHELYIFQMTTNQNTGLCDG